MAQLIVIEGTDGSGKTTQARLAVDALTRAGQPVRELSFPRYGTVGSTFVDLYLGGGLGGKPEDTGSYAASTFFACDRYVSYRTEWSADYKNPGGVILACRYTSANAVHQLSKLPREEWDNFLDWLWDYEYVKLGIPKPDKVLYLDMPPELSAALIVRRSEQTGQKRDIHELDFEYLKSCRTAALYAAKRHGWTVIPAFERAVSSGSTHFEPRSREAVHNDIMREIGYANLTHMEDK
jgi:Thymidylate kinase